ncbi:MAG: transposase family protein [Actinobacteria bacterium]|nr:transposase family protein [Actinomycetota bacterium]
MRYQSTTGLDEDKLTEVVDRVTDIFNSRGVDFSRHALNMREQIILTLSLLRNNLAQMFIADLSGISQPTASRIFRRMRPAIDQALAFTGISLEEAARDGRVILVDGTYVPTGNRPAQGQEVTKANYSGKRRCQCLSIPVAATLTGQLIATSTPVPGARHDSAAIKLTGWSTILTNTPWIADTAYTTHGAHPHKENTRARTNRGRQEIQQGHR